MEDSIIPSFQKFCRDRMISKSTEERFIQYVRDNFNVNFTGDNTITFVMRHMSQKSIQRHWVDFVRVYKKEIEEQQKGD